MTAFNKVHGDIFNSEAQLLVNPVNCVGAMGKGLALQFKNRYPDMDRQYREDCKNGLVKTGNVIIYAVPDGKLVANLPTKDHWRRPSRMEYVVDGLENLLEQMRLRELQSVAIPALGAGLGGLEWDDVEQAIWDVMNVPDDIMVEVFPPRQAKRRWR